MSYNVLGYSVITSSDSELLHRWIIPTKHGDVAFTMRRGSAGFLLAIHILWIADTIERIKGGTPDDWGWAYRLIRNGVTISMHALGLAADVNALKHILGRRGTFTRRHTLLIRARLLVYRGCIAWGGDWKRRADEMHWEIAKNAAAVEKRARQLIDSPRGRRILAANPSQRAVILS